MQRRNFLAVLAACVASPFLKLWPKAPEYGPSPLWAVIPPPVPAAADKELERALRFGLYYGRNTLGGSSPLGLPEHVFRPLNVRDFHYDGRLVNQKMFIRMTRGDKVTYATQLPNGKFAPVDDARSSIPEAPCDDSAVRSVS